MTGVKTRRILCSLCRVRKGREAKSYGGIDPAAAKQGGDSDGGGGQV